MRNDLSLSLRMDQNKLQVYHDRAVQLANIMELCHDGLHDYSRSSGPLGGSQCYFIRRRSIVQFDGQAVAESGPPPSGQSC